MTATEASVLEAYDADASGSISETEARNNGELAKRFAQLDRNRDKLLDAAEFKACTPRTSAASGAAPTTAQDARDTKAGH